MPNVGLTEVVPIAIFQNFGPMEILLIALVLILLFGGKKLADLGTGLGKGIRNFKDAMREGDKPEPPAQSTSAPKPPESN